MSQFGQHKAVFVIEASTSQADTTLPLAQSYFRLCLITHGANTDAGINTRGHGVRVPTGNNPAGELGLPSFIKRIYRTPRGPYMWCAYLLLLTDVPPDLMLGGAV